MDKNKNTISKISNSVNSSKKILPSDSQKTAALGSHSQLDLSHGQRVAVILSYYNGDKFIKEQIDSILTQSYHLLHIFVCDDKSNPPLCLQSLNLDKGQTSKISVVSRAKNLGYTYNFLNGLANAEGDFEYFAFSDQDDIWHENKLEKAIEKLEKVAKNVPALYFARTEIADAKCEQTLGLSPLFSKPPSFKNALVQNIGGGNTMVLNKAAKNIIIKSSGETSVISHDWWCYQIISGVGGNIIYDSKPCLKYRQHSNNIVGANTSWRARNSRIRGLIQGRFRTWNDVNLKALAFNKHMLTNANQRVLDDFTKARDCSILMRVALLRRSGVHRQTLLDNVALLLFVLLNRI